MIVPDSTEPPHVSNRTVDMQQYGCKNGPDFGTFVQDNFVISHLI